MKSVLRSRRLAWDAKVRELDIDGDRLRYELVSGDGPATGWVNRVSASGNALLLKCPPGEQLPPEQRARPSPDWLKPVDPSVKVNLEELSNDLEVEEDTAEADEVSLDFLSESCRQV